MRIIAGIYRGRLLRALPGHRVRPTSDRLRETLFDILGVAVSGSVFIDCYAGSGAVGLEALSRGARQVFLIEGNAAAGRILRTNLAALGAREKVEIVRASVQKGLRRLEQRGARADFCFLDPPYAAHRELARALEGLTASRLMARGGAIILQHSQREPLPEQVGGWSRMRFLAQGQSALSFYQDV